MVVGGEGERDILAKEGVTEAGYSWLFRETQRGRVAGWEDGWLVGKNPVAGWMG